MQYLKDLSDGELPTQVNWDANPETVGSLGAELEQGAAVNSEVLGGWLQLAAKLWQSDQEKIAYLESLLLRPRV